VVEEAEEIKKAREKQTLAWLIFPFEILNYIIQKGKKDKNKNQNVNQKVKRKILLLS
jgi:hypothetical protein